MDGACIAKKTNVIHGKNEKADGEFKREKQKSNEETNYTTRQSALCPAVVLCAT